MKHANVAKAFRAAMPHLQTYEEALTGHDEKAFGMCHALQVSVEIEGRGTVDCDYIVRRWALDAKNNVPESGRSWGYYVTPLTRWQAEQQPAKFKIGYTTRILFLELIALLAEDGQLLP